MIDKENTSVNVSCYLDDEAWDVSKFVQELSKVQDQYVDRLTDKVLKNGWVKNMSEADIKEWVFDYLYNGERENGYPTYTFSEHLANFGIEIE